MTVVTYNNEYCAQCNNMTRNRKVTCEVIQEQDDHCSYKIYIDVKVPHGNMVYHSPQQDPNNYTYRQCYDGYVYDLLIEKCILVFCGEDEACGRMGSERAGQWNHHCL